MPTQLQIRRGSTTDHNSFTGAAGELTVDTTKDTLRVHDGSTAGGFELARADGSNLNNITSNITFADNSKAIFGTGSDLEIYHDGANSYIKETGTGSLYLDADAFVLRNNADSGKWINCYGDTVVLNYNNSAKLTTTSTGIDVTGTATIDGGTGSATAGGTLVVRQKGDTSADGIALTSSNSVSHRIWKDASGNLNIGSSSFPSSFVQDFNGNVGIGTDSSSSQLHVYDNAVVTSSSNIDVATFQSQTANVGGAGFKSGIRLQHTTDTDKAVRITAIQANDYSNSIHMGFEVSNSSATPPYEAMRLDSDGNLLVGKTTTSNATAGAELNASGQIVGTFAGGTHILGRNTNDGSILELQKDGATVGSIGTSNSRLHIGNGDVGLLIAGDLDNITPWNSTTGASRDAAVDLGNSGVRFKDLYLSGGAYLGGTAAANKLDDYEEGTFTPTASNAQGFTLGTPTGANGSYTKIGRTVNLKCGFTSLDSTEVIAVGDRFEISGIPFNTSGNYTAATASAGSCFIYNSFGGGALATGSVTHSGSILIVFIDSVLGSPTFSNDFNIGLVYESA